jgi:hypothetical protein
MSFHGWLQKLRSTVAPRWGQRHHQERRSLQAARHRLNVEILEDRLTPSFSHAGFYPAAEYATTLGTTDFNNDGHRDLTTGTSVLLGDGQGRFGDAFDATVESDMIDRNSIYDGAAFGDCTSDGIPDRITASPASSTGWRLFVQPGRGDGTFGDPIQSVGGIFPYGPWAAADFNGDGQFDVITTSFTFDHGGWVHISLSRGDGTFAGPEPEPGIYAIGFDPRDIVIADFNEDGSPDFAALAGTWDFGGYESVVGVYLNESVPPPPPPPPEPGLRIDDVAVTEGNSGTQTATFTVTRVGDSEQTATVDFATDDFTATAGSDYQAASGTLTFAPGETSKTIDVLVTGDTLFETEEVFAVSLSNAVGAAIVDGQGFGTIANDDAAQPALSITDVTKNEGRKGKTSFTFTITLSAPSTQTVTVQFATADGTARVSDSDYSAKSGTLTFQSGQTSKTVTISVRGDRKAEPDETFFVNLSSATGATIDDGQGVGTIRNDDGGSQALQSVSSDLILMEDGPTGRKRK